eukprot:358504-Chlamydomonas_euryale.AAC.10
MPAHQPSHHPPAHCPLPTASGPSPATPCLPRATHILSTTRDALLGSSPLHSSPVDSSQRSSCGADTQHQPSTAVAATPAVHDATMALAQRATDALVSRSGLHDNALNACGWGHGITAMHGMPAGRPWAG